MLFNLLAPLSDELNPLNLFRYQTFRSGSAIIFAFFLTLLIGPRIINWLKFKQREGQPIREDGPESHLLTKKGTPTMGGLMFLISACLTTILWADVSNPYVWVVLLVTIGYGAIGFGDDFLKLTKRNTKGLPGRFKLLAQFAIGAVASAIVIWVAPEPLSTGLAVPFFKEVLIPLGWFFLPFATLVMMGSSNAVNLTDGLDGLAIVPVMMAAASLGFIAYFAGNANFADYLQLHHVVGAGELAVFCGALCGAGLGFLWFNAPPAMVFMGDTGSLSMGGALGAIAVIAKHELVLAIIGGVFVLETVSVIVQVISFKTTGRRVFRMAPLHHHFEKKGWAEPTIVIRFWIIAAVLALIGLSTLKLR
ncbi:phospho-N-acetylmuramoyl-pentapeptide-transferase [Dongia deserti]|uniref:phospho-N-acetylmuramoyl-pentapeptide- transferase n=1 Tax=Dongia deserti TaxID=2268030 RepID=UPI000E64E35C|nr:phospho-N-acetylmuramoyl-pentapeptide-transferase [Dongia deserti]